MTRKLNKDRVFRHMARDNPEYLVVRISRDDLLDLDWRHVQDQSQWIIEKYLDKWIRFAKIKHGEDVDLDLFSDYNTYRFGGRVRCSPMNNHRFKIVGTEIVFMPGITGFLGTVGPLEEVTFIQFQCQNCTQIYKLQRNWLWEAKADINWNLWFYRCPESYDRTR